MTPWAQDEAKRLIDAGVLDLDDVRAGIEHKVDWRFLYLVESAGLYKIGYARNIRSRLSSLNTNSAHRVKLVHTIPTTEYIYLEQWLHDHFHSKRTHGEWFALEQRDIATFRSAVRLSKRQ